MFYLKKFPSLIKFGPVKFSKLFALGIILPTISFQYSNNFNFSHKKTFVASFTNLSNMINASRDQIFNWQNGKDNFQDIVPPLTFESHKGQMGRIGILGGSKDYTGAPYYAGISALKVGADLVYVFTAEEAALPIKCYSPELMVTPVYSHQSSTSAEEIITNVAAFLPRLHSLVIGPGLGRSPLVLEATAGIIQHAAAMQLPMVIDADALFLVAERPDIVQQNSRIVLTPNIMEFKRIWSSVFGEDVPLGRPADLSAKLGVIIVLKGQNDIIASPVGDQLISDEEGGMRRSGGIGDILSGCLGTMVSWANEAENPTTAFCWATWGSSILVKRATRFAFLKHKRAMTAPDILNEIGVAFEDMMSGY